MSWLIGWYNVVYWLVMFLPVYKWQLISEFLNDNVLAVSSKITLKNVFLLNFLSYLALNLILIAIQQNVFKSYFVDKQWWLIFHLIFINNKNSFLKYVYLEICLANILLYTGISGRDVTLEGCKPNNQNCKFCSRFGSL